ncbi:protein lethal(3)malignant blood neoplasm 1-like [Armigeres subalbatus]|uniref:protein lethal(3)malignant blood neoplasm 1-like n=1 Tax=Armigeres subalbatus TaxID=124917 RepID=UPI002ED37264
MKTKIFIHIILLVSLVRAASKYYDGPIRPYEFGFNIEGHQHRKESKDKNGIVMGEFGFITADNVYHVTVYATDENGNFKIVSMKNYKLGPTAPPTTTSAPTTTPSTTTTTSTTPQPFRIITTAKPLTSPKPNGYAACSGCIIPETTTRSNPTTELALPETSTLYVPPFKIVNKNEIENPAATGKPITTTIQPTSNANEKSSPEDTPQKLVDKKTASKAPSSKESTNASPSPEAMQTPNKQPSSQSLDPPPTSGGVAARPDQPSNSKPTKQASPPSGGSTATSAGKFDHFNTANMMIQHILNGLLYRFNYTVGYHGHHEQGDRQGNKEGGYYAVGRDGIRRGVTYKANEFGFQPHIKFEKVSPEETPREDTEKQAGLKGFDFKWFWGES